MAIQVTESALIPGTPEEVWPLVSDPKHFRVWYAFGGAEFDLRPGSAMTLRWDEHGAFDAVIDSVTPGEFFSFRWQPEPGPLVEIRLLAEGKRTTRVRITESGGLEDPELSALAWRNGLKLLSDRAQSYYGQ